MRKIPIKLCFVVVILLSSQASGIERLMSIGQSISLPSYISPEKTLENRSYHLDLGYFFREGVHISLSFQFGLDGDQQIDLRFGPEFYLLKDRSWLPWLGTKYLYSINPQGHQGVMLQLGVEKDLDFLFGFENLVFRASSGYSHTFISGASNRKYWEMLNVGFLFTF